MSKQTAPHVDPSFRYPRPAEVVVFDLFGTLVGNYTAAEFAQMTAEMAQQLGVAADDFAREYGYTGTRRMRGVWSTVEDNLAHVCRMLGVRADAQRLQAAAQVRIAHTRRALTPRRGAVEVLTQLRARGYTIGLISDCTAEVPDLLAQGPLSPLIDVSIFSCRVGLKKPDPRIYALACERLSVSPDRCVYIGDGSSQELSGAAQAGMQPILVRTAHEQTTDPERPDVQAWSGVAIDELPELLGLINPFMDAPVLRDGPLRLRPATLPRDIASALPWYRDPEVLHYSEGEGTAAYGAAMVERMYQYLQQKGELYIVEIATCDRWLPIGDATLSRDSLPIVIGDVAYRSKGWGSRVLRLLVQRARELGWMRLATKGIYTYNERSRRLFESAGFILTETTHDEDGRPCWRFELRFSQD